MYGSKTTRVRKTKQKAKPKKKYNTAYTAPSSLSRVSGTGFPDRVMTKLKYVDTIVLQASSGPTQYVFRGNSCFDPDQTGTGHQPMFYDQWIAVYERYRVLGSSIKVQVTNGANDTAILVILPTSAVPVFTSYTTMLEQRKSSTTRIVPPQQFIPMSQTRYSSTQQATGAVRTEVYDQDYSGLYNANPTNIWYWVLYGQAVSLTQPLDLVVIVELIYYVEFFDRQNIAQS